MTPRKPKYGNKRCEYKGIRFDSLRECAYYKDLELLEKAGEIGPITVHPKYEIRINNSPVCKVILDFLFWDKKRNMSRYIDVKGRDTAVSKLKRKLLWATQHIEVEIVK